MRTSGGAGASRRRPCDVQPGALRASRALLLTLMLLCSVVAAEAASSSSQQQRDWSPQRPLESIVAVGADGIATSRGVGRRRSDGLSITRSIPVATGINPDAAVDDQAIKFSPARVDLGRMETCAPERFSVGVENRGRVSVRLDGADFTHEGFSLANDVRGIRLDPGERFNMEFVFLPREAEPSGLDAHLRVVTTSGLFSLPITSPEVAINRYGVSSVRASVPAGARFQQSLQFVNPFDYTIRITEVFAMDSFAHLELLNGSNWIGPRWPREDDYKEVKKEVHGEYDQEFDYARRADRGAWDMPAGTTNPLIKVSVQAYTPGVYFTYIHIAAGQRRLLLVPVRINVLKPGIHFEPKELDLGVLTDLYEGEPRELYFSLYNAGLNPIEVLELKVLESNMIVSAQLRGSTVIPPQTRVYQALAVQLLVNRDIVGGDCIASLLLKTNASSSELGQRKLRLYGQVIKGHLSFQLNETLMGVIMSLDRVSEKVDAVAEEAGTDEIADDQEVPTTSLVSIVGENASMVIMAGTSEFRKLRLWNRFDRPVELQRVWVADELSEQDEPLEVTVYKYKQGVVPAGAALPKIVLQIAPILQAKGGLLAARYYSLMVETNATLHKIQVHVYHGILSVQSSSGLQNYGVSGYYSSLNSKPRKQNSTQACLAVPKNGIIPAMTPRIDGGKGSTDTQAVQICRSLLFDMEKIASHRARAEVVEMINNNPVPVVLKITSVPDSDKVDVSIRAKVSPAQSVTPQFAHVGNNAGALRAVDHWSNNTTVVSTGDSFVLQPGYHVIFHVEIEANAVIGELTVPVLSMATPAEVLHLFAHFVSVEGTIEPVTPAIILPSMFPGRTEVIHLQYRNTFAHLVTPLMATVSNSKLQLLSMRKAMAPNQVEHVLELLFSPAADSKCSDAVFLADCLLPPPATMDDQTCEPLSYYGELVDEHDLDALSRRNAFWNSAQGTMNQSIIEAQVHLQTDIMDDVAEVTIKALLGRPLVTMPSGMPLHPINDSLSVFERKEFVLTELLELSHMFVLVRNPSNISIQVELTFAEADQALFYSCELDSYAKEGSKLDRVGNVTEDITELCLAEWKAAVVDAVAVRRNRQVQIDVPQFYFQRRVIHVLAGEEAQLGPLYYLPSKVQEVTTKVFVRNDLSHIEPVPLFARSGKGTLDVLVGAKVDSSKPTKARFVALEHAGATEKNDTAAQDEFFEYDGTLHFSIGQDDESAYYNQGADILLSNTGSFGLALHSVTVEEDPDVSWMPSAWISDTPSIRSDFAVIVEPWKGDLNKGDHLVVLSPNKSSHIHVLFRPSCFASSVASWLVIDTSDSVRRIRLEGAITTDAAFSCLRSRVPPLLLFAIQAAWMMAVAVVAITTLFTILILVHDAWTSDAMRGAEHLIPAANTEDLGMEEMPGDNPDELTPPKLKNETEVGPRSLSSINRLLAEMELTAFARPARVVTPAVAKLLEQRHNGVLNTSARDGIPIENAMPNNDVETRGDDGEENTMTSAATAVVIDDNTALPLVDAKIISPSYVAATVIEASPQDTKEELASEAYRTGEGSSSPTINTDEPVSGATKKQLTGSADQKPSDLFSQGDSSESSDDLLSSAGSSQSTVVQSDAEESGRSVTDFPKMLFGSLDDQQKRAVGSDQPPAVGTNSLQKEDGPFEAFKSLSARWRAEDWQDTLNDSAPVLSGKFPGIEDWNDTLSLSKLREGLTSSTAGNQRDESVGSGSRCESGNFIGSSPGLYLDGLSSFAAPAAALPTVIAPKTSTKKAPPGFSPADAKPLETRAAFEQLRSSSSLTPSAPNASSSSDGFGGSSLFASKLPLFGPALPSTSDDHIMLGGAGRIGSGRSKVIRDLDTLPK